MTVEANEVLAEEAGMPELENRTDFGANWSVNAVATALIRVNSDWADLWEPATVKAGTDLCRVGSSPHEIFFPFEGLTSVMQSIVAPGEPVGDPGTEVQVNLLGASDCVNVWALLSEVPCPFRVTVHSGWAGLRCSAQAARRLLARDETSRAIMLRYVQGIMVETYQNLACSQRFTSNQRVAAWLLQCSETLMTDALPLTHRFGGDMLGIRRATVTLAIQELEKLGLVDSSSSRGRINVLNAAGLEAYAGPCWSNMRAHRQRLIADLAAG